MTNKQAYAGLLERLGDHCCARMGPNPFYECKSCNVRDEAAEAISSLLKALERIANHFDMDGYEGDAWKALALEMAEVARAALNSDAPLSIGEAQ